MFVNLDLTLVGFGFFWGGGVSPSSNQEYSVVKSPPNLHMRTVTVVFQKCVLFRIDWKYLSLYGVEMNAYLQNKTKG